MQLSHRTRAHQSWYRLLLKTIITFSGSGAELLRATQIVREMVTAEQMQESLQQPQAQAARIVALETQLQLESARAQTPVQERSALIQTLVTIRQERAEVMVEMKGISQPFILKGVGQQDLGEWTHKVRTFMLARFGDQILGALTWASRQRKIVVKRLRTFAERPPHILDRCLWRRCRRGGPDRGDRFCWKDLRIPCVLYNRRSQQDRPKRRRRQRLGSLETTAQRIRPHVVHATRGNPSAGSEPTALSAS